MSRTPILRIRQTLDGSWRDDAGNRYNERNQRIDYLGRVIPDPWEEPARPSIGYGGASIPVPRTLADFNNPAFFLHIRAQLQEEIDLLEGRLPKRAYELQDVYSSCDEPSLQVTETQVQREDEASKELDVASQSEELIKETSMEEEISEVGEIYSEEGDEIERLLYAEEVEFEPPEGVSIDTPNHVDRHSLKTKHPEFPDAVSIDKPDRVDRHTPADHIPSPISRPAEPQHTPKPPVYVPDPPDPLPKPLDPHDTQILDATQGDTLQLTVIPDKEATPGSYKQKPPNPALHPPRKRLRAYPGVVVIIDAYLVNPGDAYTVYSKGPRPPPPKHRFELSTLSLSYAGKSLNPPRDTHPLAAYTLDPAVIYAVYHFGPRPP